jgi:23S rRNA (cytosine1962-C5)-methyltransferase
MESGWMCTIIAFVETASKRLEIRSFNRHHRETQGPLNTVILKPGRDDSLRRRHPWIYSGALQDENPSTPAGQTVAVRNAHGQLLAVGAYSPHSQIRVRVWSFDPSEVIGPEFFSLRLGRALQARETAMRRVDTTALRLVNAESDGLPGLVVDRYADFLVCQFLSAGAERWKSVIVGELTQLTPAVGVYERSDTDSRGKEGLELRCGTLWGGEPPERIEIREGPLRFLVDVRNGHKTGFYLDQRDNRTRVGASAFGADVLNCFAYTGAFGLHALNGGAVGLTQVERSAEALEVARRHLVINGFDPDAVEAVNGDVFEVLRAFRDRGRTFDRIVLDPPKFAASAAQVKRAARGYKDINLLAFKLLRPGGLLFTFSCSGHVEPSLFQKIVADAAGDAGRHAQILRRLDAAADHAVALDFPEGAYLKGLICRVD